MAPSRRLDSAWSVHLAVTDVPEAGTHIDLIADETARAAVAALAGVRQVDELSAHLDVHRHGSDGFRVAGHVRARIGQDCVVTLEPIESEVREEIDVVFVPNPLGASAADVADDAHEALKDGRIDLAGLATEFLLLGIDPYPRKPGAVFTAPEGQDGPGPFAALQSLKKPRGG